MDKKFLVIVAGQRSGTTALQSALASTGQYENFSEIFHTDSDRAGQFLDFCKTRDVKVADMATYEQAKKICNDYLNYLLEKSGSKFPLIDVKLNSWMALRPFWAYPHEEPFLLSALKNRGASFIFITRKDISSQIFSEMIARQTQKWHNLENEDITDNIEIDIAKARTKARLIIQAENLLYGMLKNYPKVATCYYEDMFSGAELNADFVERLSAITETSLPDVVKSQISKNAGKKASIITNYDEAVQEIEKVASRFGRPKFDY